jgi:NAD(P)-dependent dehydrogenase (short-subunit alcohol dehydrogenase family)
MIQITTGCDLFRLDNRVAFVSGAAGHLGQSIARVLCEAGAHVILCGRNAQNLNKFNKALHSAGFNASTVVCDIADENHLVRAWDEIGRTFERIDIIVNNAYHGSAGTFAQSTWGDFDNAYRIAVGASFRIIQLATPLLTKTATTNAGGASVINIASMYGTVSPDPGLYGDSGQNNPPYYGAAKAGLIQLTRYAACHLASQGIRVNAISPGPFPVPEVTELNPEFYHKLCGKNPMRRIGHPDELKGPILFLASDASSYVTGINLPVDGGWTAW